MMNENFKHRINKQYFKKDFKNHEDKIKKLKRNIIKHFSKIESIKKQH